jgi:hypothetical protein
MTVSEENKQKMLELAGAQRPTRKLQKRIDRSLRIFKHHFPSLNWWGNTPIEPTGAGLTYAESISWLRHILHHLSDWAGQMDKELGDLINEINNIYINIEIEITEILPDIIDEYDLFDLIVTGNNERTTEVNNQATTTTIANTLFSYVFRTQFGFIEATKTNEFDVTCETGNAIWAINVNERKDDGIAQYTIVLNNIPQTVNRVWVVTEDNVVDGNRGIYYIYDKLIRKAEFNKNTMGSNSIVSLNFQRLNTNYEPYWIVNVFKEIPENQNYLHYMTLDYKVYEYDLVTGKEELLYQIPAENQEIFDPIADVIEGKSTIWAISYRGTVIRSVDEMNGLCFEPCFDGVELYDTWETPKKITFTKNFCGIVPANMYIDYANNDTAKGDKELLSAFILTQKQTTNMFVTYIYQMMPKKFDNSIISGNLEDYFKGSLVNNLIDLRALADYQGYYSYNLGSDIGNFTDAPNLLIDDTKNGNDGAKFHLENTKFLANGNTRVLLQRLILINPENSKTRTIRCFERVIQQTITMRGISWTKTSRWADKSPALNRESINSSLIGDEMDYLSLAGTRRTFQMADYESKFIDTPLKEYVYGGDPLQQDHPLFANKEKKQVIVEITKGANDESNDAQYEIVFKLTYQDDYAELQMRRLMRFARSNDDEKFGGRTHAVYKSPWAYVYYTTPDDLAPPGYEVNPNININFEIDINNIYNDINNIYTDLEGFKKILLHLESIGVWHSDSNGDIFKGDFVAGMGVAGGNISLYGGTADGSSWIKTTAQKRDNDLVAGIASSNNPPEG